MNNHTPGPWVPDFPVDGRAPTIIRSERPVVEGAIRPVEVARIVGRLGHQGNAPCGNYRDNARLIAAAPELLQALVDLMTFVSCDSASGTKLSLCRKAAVDAIRKARGEQ